MIEAIKQKLYHIHRVGSNSENWKVGNSFSVGSDYNPLYKRIYETQIKFEEKEPGSLIKDEIGVVNWLHNQRTNEPTLQNKIYLQRNYHANSFVNKTAISLLQLTREIVLEQVRTKDYPEKPSRLKGMWFSDYADVKRWCNILTDNKNSLAKIFRVEFTGKLHKGDERWINNDSLSINSYYKNANGYWEGIPKSKKGKACYEILGEGSFTIEEEIEL